MWFNNRIEINSMVNLRDPYDYVIVGGGVSGLYSALKLLETFPLAKVILLEEKKRLGGRVYVSDDLLDFKKQKASFSLGAGVIRSGDKNLLQLLKNLNIETVTLPDQKVKRVTFCEGSTLSKQSLNDLLREFTSIALNNYELIVNNRYNFEQFLRRFYPSSVINRITSYFTYTDFLRADVIDTLNLYPKEDIFWETGAEKNPIVIKGGWKVLINTLFEKLSTFGSRFTILNQCKVNKTEEMSLGVQVEFFHKPSNKNYSFMSQKIIYAVTVNKLAFLRPELNAVKEIGSHPFVKVISSQDISIRVPYDIYFNPETRAKKTIVIDQNRGILLPVFCDGEDTIFWKDMKKDSHSDKLKTLIQNHLNDLSKTNPSANFGKVIDAKIKYWEEGIHFYLPVKRLKEDKKIREREQMIKEYIYPTKKTFIVGEMVSMNQGWVEGGIESVERLFDVYKNQLKNSVWYSE